MLFFQSYVYYILIIIKKNKIKLGLNSKLKNDEIN